MKKIIEDVFKEKFEDVENRLENIDDSLKLVSSQTHEIQKGLSNLVNSIVGLDIKFFIIENNLDKISKTDSLMEKNFLL